MKRANGEGSISKMKNGRYKGQVFVPTAEGGRKRVQIYGKTSAEVAEKMKPYIFDPHPVPSNTRLADWLNEWLDVYSKPKVRQTTWESYECMVRVHIAPALGVIPIKELTPQQIQRFYNLKGKERSGRTVAYIHAVLDMALAKAVDLELIQKNPCDKVEVPAYESKKIHPLDVEQLRHFLEVARSHRLYPAFMLEAVTGLRRGEILALTWEEVDFNKKTIAVKRGLVRTTEGLKFQPPKTKSSARIIPIPAEAVDVLKDHFKTQQKERLEYGLSWEGNLLFTSVGGRPIDPRNFTRAFEGVIKKAGLPKTRFHDMRHSFATLLLEAGESKAAQEMLGHARYAITLDIYSHLLPKKQEKVADYVGDILARPRKTANKKGTAAR